MALPLHVSWNDEEADAMLKEVQPRTQKIAEHPESMSKNVKSE